MLLINGMQWSWLWSLRQQSFPFVSWTFHFGNGSHQVSVWPHWGHRAERKPSHKEGLRAVGSRSLPSLPGARHVMMLLPSHRVTSSLWDVSAEAPDITKQRQTPNYALPTVLIREIISEIQSWLQPAKFGDNSLCNNKNKNSLYSTHHNSYASSTFSKKDVPSIFQAHYLHLIPSLPILQPLLRLLLST